MDQLKNVSKTVITCYDLLDACLAGGIPDFTEGRYDDDKSRPYEIAQKKKAEWMVNKIKCKKGDKILDVGCGNGTILKEIKARGAHGIGITISVEQVKRCQEQGFEVYLMDYKDMPKEWDGVFDGIIASGPIEHFVQAEDVILGKKEEIYTDMFKIFNRVLKKGRFMVNSTIHFNQEVDAKEVLKGYKQHKRHSDYFHWAILKADFGGWYPKRNELKKCAKKYFESKFEEDATLDYHLTSEYWLEKMKTEMKKPKIWLVFLRKFLKHPRSTIRMVDDLMFAQSWMWQFRERDGKTPTILIRNVWKKKEIKKSI